MKNCFFGKGVYLPKLPPGVDSKTVLKNAFFLMCILWSIFLSISNSVLITINGNKTPFFSRKIKSLPQMRTTVHPIFIPSRFTKFSKKSSNHKKIKNIEITTLFQKQALSITIMVIASIKITPFSPPFFITTISLP